MFERAVSGRPGRGPRNGRVWDGDGRARSRTTRFRASNVACAGSERASIKSCDRLRLGGQPRESTTTSFLVRPAGRFSRVDTLGAPWRPPSTSSSRRSGVSCDYDAAADAVRPDAERRRGSFVARCFLGSSLACLARAYRTTSCAPCRSCCARLFRASRSLTGGHPTTRACLGGGTDGRTSSCHVPARLTLTSGAAKSPRALTRRPEPAAAVSCPRDHTPSSASVSVLMTDTSSTCSPDFGGRNSRKSIRPVEAVNAVLSKMNLDRRSSSLMGPSL